MTSNDTPPAAPRNPLDADGHEMVCRDCFWYRGSVLSGLCFGAPPSVYVSGLTQDLAGNTRPQLGSAWPIVDGHRFCGAFRYDHEKIPEPLLTADARPHEAADAAA